MSTKQLERPTDRGTRKPPLMVHIVDPNRPGPVALCGRRLTRILDSERTIDCVVCNDLWERGA